MVEKVEKLSSINEIEFVGMAMELRFWGFPNELM